MGNYDELTDREKCVDFPDEFVEELRGEFLAGHADTALERAEQQGIDIREIIN